MKRAKGHRVVNDYDVGGYRRISRVVLRKLMRREQGKDLSVCRSITSVVLT